MDANTLFAIALCDDDVDDVDDYNAVDQVLQMTQ
jgi:hypothetical protein